MCPPAETPAQAPGQYGAPLPQRNKGTRPGDKTDRCPCTFCIGNGSNYFLCWGNVVLIGRAHTCVDVIDPFTFPSILSGVKQQMAIAPPFNDTGLIEFQESAGRAQGGATCSHVAPRGPPPCTSRGYPNPKLVNNTNKLAPDIGSDFPCSRNS